MIKVTNATFIFNSIIRGDDSKHESNGIIITDIVVDPVELVNVAICCYHVLRWVANFVESCSSTI